MYLCFYAWYLIFPFATFFIWVKIAVTKSMNKFSFLKVTDVLSGIGKPLDIEPTSVAGAPCFKR